MGRASRRKREKREHLQAKANDLPCVYYTPLESGYVGVLVNREQGRAMRHSVLICDESETSQFSQWGNEIANQYVIDKALSLGFLRIGDSAFFKRTTQGRGYVYFIEAVGLSRVKIGYSEDPESRLRQLLTGSPMALKLYAKMPGNQAMEKDIHARFRHLKVENEWFHFTDEIKSYIEKNCI